MICEVVGWLIREREKMKEIKVYNIYDTPPSNAIYIGRGSAWGNPFKIGEHGSRYVVIGKFAEYAKTRLENEPEWLKPLKETTGLVCYCSPKACHGDVLALLLKESE